MISHGHTDHIGAAVIHARAKALSSTPATYYVPSAILEHLQAARAAFEAMDEGPIPMNIIAVDPGAEFMISPHIKAKVIQTKHRVPSQGYALYSISQPRLLEQYQGLPPNELKDLKKLGVKIVGEREEHLEMVYTGDTTFAGLLTPENRFIFDAPILIMELTYLDRDIAKAAQYGHVHIQDIVENADVFNNDQIVFVHLSQKYNVSSALSILRSNLPVEIAERAKVSLYSFGAREMLTDILPRRRDSYSSHSSSGRYSGPGRGSGKGGGDYHQEYRKQKKSF